MPSLRRCLGHRLSEKSGYFGEIEPTYRYSTDRLRMRLRATGRQRAAGTGGKRYVARHDPCTGWDLEFAMAMQAQLRIGEAGEVGEGAVPVRRMGASSRGAFELLRVAFVLIPVLSGLDKFTNFLSDWTKYIAPVLLNWSPLSPSALMYVVGFIEVFIGFLVIAAPRIGALAFAGWIGIVVLDLALLREFWDVALRNLGLMLGAFALAQLGRVHEEVEFSMPRRRLRRAEPARMPRTDTLASPSET